MREANTYGVFPEVCTLLKKERMLRHIRKTKTIVEILGGDWFLKISSLNLTCYVLNFPREKFKKEGDDMEYEREIPPVLIEGWK
jgi:anaerobic ribonucleoside-triphosphate reductase